MSIDTIPTAALILAAVVLVPLAVRLIGDRVRAPDGGGAGIGRPPRLLALARLSGVPAGVALAASVALPPGPVAAALAVPWLAVSLLLALHGAGRLARIGLFSIESGVSVGLIDLAVGALWALAWRAGAAPLGYPPLIVLLTAVHFHVAGCLLPLLLAFLGRDRARSPGAARLAAIGVAAAVVAVPVTAIGIAASRPLELAGGLCLAAGGMIGGIASLLAALGDGAARRRLVARLALAISGGSLLIAMPLAAAFDLGLLGFRLGLGSLSAIELMALTHGLLVLIGFAGCGLLAWTLAPPPALPPPPPFSRLTSHGRTGARYFADRGLELSGDRTLPDGRPAPAGLVDSLEELAHAGFDPAAVAPAIRAFYERTADHELRVWPAWRPGFRLGARLWAAVARRLDQLQLPLADERADDPLGSRIVALDDARDGRPGARGWIRTYAADGRALYVSAYATHRSGDLRYMNIAFPLPFANLASILRMDPLDGGAICVTTIDRPGQPGDAGIWIVLRAGRWQLPVRLPMNESVSVWATGQPGIPADLAARAPANAVAMARHDLWLAGIRFLTLTYVIRR